jgi:hypothetical protein
METIYKKQESNLVQKNMRQKQMKTMKINYSKNFLRYAHIGSASHKDEIINRTICGCFYCENLYFSTEIEQWYVEDRISTGGETAICPKCHIDSVLSDRFPIFDKKFLSAMKKYWFF